MDLSDHVHQTADRGLAHVAQEAPQHHVIAERRLNSPLCLVPVLATSQVHLVWPWSWRLPGAMASMQAKQAGGRARVQSATSFYELIAISRVELLMHVISEL